MITELPVAAGGRSTQSDIEIPLQKLVEDKHVQLIQAEITSLDLANRRVITAIGSFEYGTLVIALGSVTAFFGVPGLEDHALTLKSADDAETIRERVDQEIAASVGLTDPDARQAGLTTIIGGAGLTGVELAGELAEFIPKAAKEHGIDPREPKIVLVEGGPSVLPGLAQSLQVKAGETLQNLNVAIRTGTRVTAADDEGVMIGAAGRINGRTLIWTGGIMALPLLAQAGLPTAKNGQVIVDPYMRATGSPDVYAIGDSALCAGGGTESPAATHRAGGTRPRGDRRLQHLRRPDGLSREALSLPRQGPGRLGRYWCGCGLPPARPAYRTCRASSQGPYRGAVPIRGGGLPGARPSSSRMRVSTGQLGLAAVIAGPTRLSLCATHPLRSGPPCVRRAPCG